MQRPAILAVYAGSILAPKTRVNTIIPGGVLGDFDEEFVKNYSEMTPMKRMMKKDEILGGFIILHPIPHHWSCNCRWWLDRMVIDSFITVRRLPNKCLLPFGNVNVLEHVIDKIK